MESECHSKRIGKSFFRGSFAETMAAVRNGTCKFGLILDSTLQDAIHGEHCGHLLSSEEQLYTAGLSMILPNNSNLTSAMSMATLVLRNEASTPSMQEYFQKKPQCPPIVGSVLTFQKLHYFFLCASCACLIFIIMRIVKSIWSPNTNLSHKEMDGSSEESASSSTTDSTSSATIDTSV